MEENDAAENKHGANTEIEELAKDYSRYLHVNATKERQAFYDSIEEMLTKLDEFGGFVDMIRSDTKLCLNENVPRLKSKCEEMKDLFSRIDQLEAFVGVVRQNTSMMEALVDKGEQDMGSFSVKNFFSSLLGPKKQPQSKENRPTFDPPDIFVTEECLTPSVPVQKKPVEQAQEPKDAEKTEEPSKNREDDT